MSCEFSPLQPVVTDHAVPGLGAMCRVVIGGDKSWSGALMLESVPRSQLQRVVLHRVLNARQLGLKLIANVTYGYTSASFSGRMPMSELADSIVASGRQTLENAITLIESNPEWSAKVVYGDTDSMFVHLPGRSKAEAFRIGAEIAQAVTAANPPPVVLKFEKVYHPCILQTKKRYVGYMYETPNQASPVFDAKGIETVRRDTVPAVAKMLEHTLRLLFATKDLSQVKTYLCRQWSKILSSRVTLQDFVFAQEVRFGSYSERASNLPPAAVVATRAKLADPRAEPLYGERVPYLVVYGEPGARLIDQCVPPKSLIESGGNLRLHGLYYIKKQINPALARVLELVGADVGVWFENMPHSNRQLPQKRHLPPTVPQAPRHPHGPNGPAAGPSFFSRKRGVIDQYYMSRHCAVCDDLTRASQPLCAACLEDPQKAMAVMLSRASRLERQYMHMLRICRHCGGGGGLPRSGTAQPCGAGSAPGAPGERRSEASNARVVAGGTVSIRSRDDGVVCDSLDCGIFFERRKLAHESTTLSSLAACCGDVWPDD
eukprot:gene22552-29677_t